MLLFLSDTTAGKGFIMRDLLLVIDMQNDFIDGALGTKEAVAIVPKVAEKIRNFKGTVLYTRDTHFENYMDTQEGRNLPVPHCIRGSQGWEIRPELEQMREAAGAEAVDKVTFGSMELGPKLQEMNAENPISSITLIGLCTDICVISNAMIAKAFLPEVPITVDASCCAGVSLPTHDNALSAMEVCQIKVVNKPVTITWLGHSCFKLEKEGYVLITDPYKDDSVPGLSSIRETADAVFCSHEHGDHNGRENVCIRQADCTKAVDSDETENGILTEYMLKAKATVAKAGPFTVTSIETYHDEVKGAKRGKNTIRIFDDGNVRIAHFGDIGCELKAEQVEILRGVDVAMIPVGGYYTIGPKEAAGLAEQIQAKHVIPMHYRDDDAGFGYNVIGTVKEYAKAAGSCTFRKESTFRTDQGIPEKTIILVPLNAYL